VSTGRSVAGCGPRAVDVALHEPFGAEDPRFAGADDRLAVVVALLRALPQVDRAVLAMTYLETLSQREIAEQFGLSQMRVSRIKDRALRRLRALGAHESAAP
jgi:RNA polymerase sigma-B factor